MRQVLNLIGTTLADNYQAGAGQLQVVSSEGFATATPQAPIPIVVAQAASAYSNLLDFTNCTLYLCTGASNNILSITLDAGTDRDYQVGDIVECRQTAGDITEIQGLILYTNPTPTPVNVGGVPAGSTFQNQTIKQVFDELLYPYQSPAFTGFGINYSVLEVGDSTSTITFTWAASNTSNIVAHSLVISQEFGVPVLSNLSVGDSPQSVVDVDVLNAPGVLHWSITGQNTRSVNFSAQVAVSWRWRGYFGNTTVVGPSAGQVQALSNSNLNGGFVGTYSFPAAPSNFPTLAFPTSYGVPSSFKDAATGFAVAMRSPLVLALTNGFGVSTNYNIWQTFNSTSGALNIVVS